MSVPSQQSLEEAFRYCREITRVRARNFYYGLKLTPEPKRSAMYAVYAWMRQADDLADGAVGPIDERRRRIEAFRARTCEVFGLESARADGAADAAVDDRLWTALGDVAGTFNLSAQPFFDMLDGQLDDLEQREYRSFEELRRFCYKVASTVGLVCIEVWGFNHPSAHERAVDQGIAFQLTNIIRDFKQDFDHGHCYLPAEELARAGLDAATLRTWSKPSACADFILAQCNRAELYYERSRDLITMIAPDCRPTLWAMAEIYHGLLRRIRKDPAAVVHAKRVRLSSITKAAIAFRANRMSRSAELAEAQLEFTRTPVVRGAVAP
jgi:15-cis-phytoene synthase